MKKLLFTTLLALPLLTSCTNLHSVIATTQTGLGVSVSENPSTQLYELRFGFFRNEFTFVPGDTNHPGTVPDVLMELRYENIIKGGSLYQRLAVGSTAVTQPGATLLFGKDSNGNLNSNVVATISQKISSIPSAVTNSATGGTISNLLEHIPSTK